MGQFSVGMASPQSYGRLSDNDLVSTGEHDPRGNSALRVREDLDSERQFDLVASTGYDLLADATLQAAGEHFARVPVNELDGKGLEGVAVRKSQLHGLVELFIPDRHACDSLHLIGGEGR